MKMEYQNTKSNTHLFVKAHIVNLNDEEIDKHLTHCSKLHPILLEIVLKQN